MLYLNIFLDSFLPHLSAKTSTNQCLSSPSKSKPEEQRGRCIIVEIAPSIKDGVDSHKELRVREGFKYWAVTLNIITN